MWVCACVCVCICWTFVHSLYSSICFIRTSIFTAMTAEIKKSKHDQSLLTYTSNTYLFSPEDSREHRQNCGKNRSRLHHHPSPPFYFP